MTSFRRYPARDFVPGNGPGGYLPIAKVENAVNAALAAGQPLLVMGESGVGKTDLAASVAWHLGWELHTYVVRSDSRGRDALYRYDHLQRLFDAQVLAARAGKDDSAATLEEARQRFADSTRYVRYEALGKAFVSPKPCVVLIDEVDKAPPDFPNDLLHEIDARRDNDRPLVVEEVEGLVIPGARAERLVVFTSNDERDLPAAFLRRCVFLQIPFPDKDRLDAIVRSRIGKRPEGAPPVPDDLATAATGRFRRERDRLKPAEWKKIPSVGELLRWIEVLAADAAPVKEGGLGTIPERIAALARSDNLGSLHPGVLVKTLRDAEILGISV